MRILGFGTYRRRVGDLVCFCSLLQSAGMEKKCGVWQAPLCGATESLILFRALMPRVQYGNLYCKLSLILRRLVATPSLLFQSKTLTAVKLLDLSRGILFRSCCAVNTVDTSMTRSCVKVDLFLVWDGRVSALLASVQPTVLALLQFSPIMHAVLTKMVDPAGIRTVLC